MHDVYSANMERRDETSYCNVSVTWCFMCWSILPVKAFISTSVFSMSQGATKISKLTLLQHYSVKFQTRNPKKGTKCDLKQVVCNFLNELSVK